MLRHIRQHLFANSSAGICCLWLFLLLGPAALALGATTQDPVISYAEGKNHSIAVLFVGHGEPETLADWSEHHLFADGSSLGPSGETLGVPPDERDTIYAAAYEEIATAMSYQMKDMNGNGIKHELALTPQGDVPASFTYPAFKGMVQMEMAQLGMSPHNTLVFSRINAMKTTPLAAFADFYWAMLDARPMIPDAVSQIKKRGHYSHVIVIPLFLSSDSTHTQEIREMVPTAMARNSLDAKIIFGKTFFENDYVLNLHLTAIAGQVEQMRGRLPPEAANQDIGVVIAGHGDPFVLPYPEFGYEEGDIHSNLTATENTFARLLARRLPYESLLGVNEFRLPNVGMALEEMLKRNKSHILVVPAIFPTASFHSMWDIPMKVLKRPIKASEGYGSRAHESGTVIWYSPLGYGDSAAGASLIRRGLQFTLAQSLLEVAYEKPQAVPELARFFGVTADER
jgi:protoheme ferro-lyase